MSGTLWRMRLRRTAILWSLALAVPLGCGGRQSTPVFGLTAKDDGGFEFFAELDSCENGAQVAVEESETTVALRGSERRRGLFYGGPSCADAIPITLSQPLGSRKVIDANSGEQVEVDSTP